VRAASRPVRLLLALLATGAVACGGPQGGGAPASPPPGVVLICLDTLRADALPPPGGLPGPLPSLAAFAQSATRFADATANAPWTSPSVASLLTGLFPRQHGVTLGFDPTANRTLPSAVRTIAEVLAEHGWFTAACTGGGWITPDQGFGQGFRFFSGDFDVQDPRRFLASWDERRPKDRPFLLFLHTFAAHDPYGEKSSQHRSRCETSPEAESVGRALSETIDAGTEIPPALYADFVRHFMSDICRRTVIERALGPERMRPLYRRLSPWMQGGWTATDDGGARLAADLRAAYVRGLAWVDARLEQTLAGLESLRLPPATVVAVVTDHGELFGEAGQLYHGQSLSDAALRTVLLLRAPGRLAEGRVVAGGCSLADVTPTLLDLAGVPVPHGLDGRSLLPLARGEEPGHPCVAEGELVARDGLPARGAISVRVPAAKWVLVYDLSTGVPLEESVFDLVADPTESSPRPARDLRPWGEAFCRRVARARADIAGRFGLPPPAEDCGPR
jgi:arylsulfatase A-like enzyme